uniref:Uncharacterized protein n=1 Tax=Arundo donax TaxID=35708 RepID=A0A0A9HDT6_ARUDO
MASASLASSPFLPSLPAANPNKAASLRVHARRLPVSVSAAPSGAAVAAARERRRFLERYGLNPDDFEDDAEEDSRVCPNNLGSRDNDFSMRIV